MSLIVFENDLFVLANKPHNIPTVPLKTQNSDGTLLEEVGKICPEIFNVCGKNPWEYGALHRLDTATAGLVLFAKKQSFYDYMISIQNSDKFEKTYLAVCDNDVDFPLGFVSSYFRSFGPKSKLVKAEHDVKKAESDRLYTTYIKRIDKGTYMCKLTRGFRHQIRVHLASSGCPISGDQLYNPKPGTGDMQLTCTGVQFPLSDGSVFTYTLQ